MTSVYVNGRRRQLSPNAVIGKGGEADVYDLSDGTVLKLYKQPSDPDYMGNPTAQSGAVQRLKEQQHKLPAFPKGLPGRVIAPIELAYDKNPGKVVGYTMQYLRDMEVLLAYADRGYRERGGVDANRVVQIFADLHGLVEQVHAGQVVIGDFNDLNVLVDQNDQVYLVDADSMQFGKFHCQAFTTRFVDPLRCEPDQLVLARPHTPDSDWYAFSVMLFQSLLFVGPYGGVHRPKSGKRLQHDARVLARIPVFGREVQYPKPALPYDRLPDELLEHFQRVYEKDLRGVFPEGLLVGLRWTVCTSCGAVHARPKCPACAAPGIVRQTIVKRGTVTATRLFRTTGRILHATHQGGKLRYLYHEAGAFRREDGSEIISGNLDPELRFRINRDTTLLGKRERLLVFTPGAKPEVLGTETVGRHLAMFDANERNYFWLQNGQLVRNGRIGADFVGDILSGRTLFWTGNQFGFGFYQAGQLLRAFVFDVHSSGLNDQVAIPALPGQLIDATCTFSDTHAWFMVSLQDKGKLINRCFVIRRSGEVVAETTAGQDDLTWLGAGIRGRFASGSSLFAATDEGIVRVTVESGIVSVAQTFPDTEPFVDATTQLLSGDGGIYAVSSREITHLKIQ